MTTVDSPLNVVLYEPEIPLNTGSIGRTCVAVGAKLWLVRPLRFQLDDRSLRRAGLDYWPHLDWELVNGWSDLVRRLRQKRQWLFSTSGERLYTDVQFQLGDSLVFGPETRGLPCRLLEANPDRTLRIPLRPEARCLNLANAASIAIYEAMRQINLWNSG